MTTRTKFIEISAAAWLLLLIAWPAILPAATITVTSAANSGAGTLRAALAGAANGDTITFAIVTPATIKLTSGELLVNRSVTILGPGSGNLAVDGNGASRVFHVTPDVTVVIAGLTITNGAATGATPDNLGGGIYSDAATVTVSNCTLSGNSATDSGGGIYNDGYAASATLHVLNSTFTGNTAGVAGGGIYNDGSSGGNALLTVRETIIGANTAEFGGGLYNDGESTGSATLLVNACVISANSAVSTNGYGGGIYNDGYSGGTATLDVRASTLSANTAGAAGGGIYNDGEALGNAAVTVHASTLNGNSAPAVEGYGGAIYNDGYQGAVTLAMSASTLSSNVAGSAGGGVYNDGESTGSATLQVSACTLHANAAEFGGGIYHDAYLGSAMLEIGSTILNASAVGENIFNDQGTITSHGYNLSSDRTGGNSQTGPGGFLNGTADQRNTDPLLDPAGLKDNGGPTPTIALQSGSPAIDHGKRDAITTLASDVDQRGESRPYDDPTVTDASGSDGSDIGAYEASVRITAADRLGTQLHLGYTTVLGRTYEIQSRTNLTAGGWSALPGSTPGTGGIAQMAIPDAFSQTQQYFRVYQLP